MQLEHALKKYFGYSSFRMHQKEAIEKILEGKDVLIVMATGSGKSLCYQIAPVVTKKTAIVISPLISLMQDQVMSLSQKGIKAEHLSSAQKDSKVISVAQNGGYDVLYMSPEKACNLDRSFWLKLREKGVCLVAIDEAHCISEWGHDFREEYKKLGELRKYFPNVPFVALTATATERVRIEIVQSLKLERLYTVIGSFDRPNLYYAVNVISCSYSFRIDLVNEVCKQMKEGGSTIIYCTTIKDCEEVWQSFKDSGVDAGLYHGKISTDQREYVHRLFVKDELQLIVATVAFGMGIDKPNIRCVIHYGCPKSLESYYQESGRCGRDGMPSRCILYYSRSDFVKGEYYFSEARTENRRKAIQESFRAAEKYCGITTCRRKYILDYFGENVSHERCGNCDNCNAPVIEKEDMVREAYLLLSCVYQCGNHWGLKVPVDVLRGSRTKKVTENNYDKLPFHGLGKHFSANWWKAFAGQLVSLGYLNEKAVDMYRIVSITPSGEHFLRLASQSNDASLLLTPSKEMISELPQKVGTMSSVAGFESMPALQNKEFSEMEVKLYDRLLQLRMELAQAESTAPYAVCSELTLQKLAKVRPTTMARLGNIDGVNEYFMARYGYQMLATIKSLSESVGLRCNEELRIQSIDSKQPSKISVPKIINSKLEAWKMFQEQGLTFVDIANLPERPVPIKESTVLGYVLEVARAGYELHWHRFMKESGFTCAIAKEIETGIKKAGSKEKLKMIKDQVPEFVTYDHIKIYLTMEELGKSVYEVLGTDLSDDEERAFENISSANEAHAEVITDENDSIPKASNHFSEKSNLNAPDILMNVEERRKRQKTGTSNICAHEDSHDKPDSVSEIMEHEEKQQLQATKNSLLSWLDEVKGATETQILQHFKGSCSSSVVELLSELESDFMVYRKNGVFKVM